MHRRPLLSLLPLGTALLLTLAACSSAVKATPFEGSDTPACRDVAQAWPVTVAGLQPRETAVDDDTVAAWGDPAIIARCGAPVPGPTTDQCLDIGGVDWVLHQLDDGVRFTTYGRDPAIEVLVPAAYAPEPLLMPAFATVAERVPQGEHHCS